MFHCILKSSHRVPSAPAARGADFAAVCAAADELRRWVCGDTVTYVVNRNINYTNVREGVHMCLRGGWGGEGLACTLRCRLDWLDCVPLYPSHPATHASCTHPLPTASPPGTPQVCTYKCSFCAFSKGKAAEALRGAPYLLPLEEITRRAAEAWERGATEVCMQV